ncbi:MAG: amino acid adenylation domain-containing protein, partial [Desulfobacterales bacterium]|nr:amino acid adenylation domain-containing protein [Desulfobacterales bacterium]
RTPVFNVMFAMQDVSGVKDISQIGDMSYNIVEIHQQTTKFDMTIFAFDTGDNVEMRIEYNTDLFDPDTMERFSRNFTNLLNEVVNNSYLPISQYDILGKEERRKLLVDFNTTDLDYPRDKSLVDLFESVVEKAGSQDAVAFGEVALGYDKLNARANQLAHCLRSRGITPGDCVGMITGTAVESIVSILGILKAGGAYMPIDPDYPEGRVAYMLMDSKAKLVVGMAPMAEKIPAEIDMICLDRDNGVLDGFDTLNPEHVVGADDIAYVIYTSGSTGKPKGTLVPHRGVVNLVHALEKEVYSRYNGSLNVAQVASFSFDASVQQIFASLLLGHTLYPIPGDMKRDMDALIPYILKHEINVIDGTPSLWELMVGSGIADEAALKLKHIVIGGEALPVNLVARFNAGGHGSDVQWTNVYGVTESSVDSTAFLVDLEKLKDRLHVPIGRPVANTKIYILSRDMSLLPIGVPGEIFIGGAGLAIGYLNNPERTQASFVSDPFTDGERLYQTGDLGRWLPDGSIEFLGRIDFQVKIRGFRIELGEVAFALSENPKVDDCVVVTKPDVSGDLSLVAYYVSQEEIPVSELRAAMAKTLPDYMIPRRFVLLDELPLNSSGKIDRKALPEPDKLRSETVGQYVAPRNEIEDVLSSVWQEVLGLNKVGIFDNFFDLGGDSIVSLQVVSRLKNRGYEIRPRDMFEYQTISEISPIVDTIKRVEVDQGPVTGEAVLTPIQRYYFNLGLANENHYNQSLMFKSKIPIDDVAFRKSLQAIIEHHDVLRTRFKDSKMMFQPLGEEVSLKIKDVASNDALFKEADKLQASLDITQGPLFAAGLFRNGKEDHILFVGHHLVVDGVTWRILLEDLMTGYGAALNNKEIVFPEKSTSYKEWANKLGAYADRSEIREEISYWETLLSKDTPDLPIDHDLGENTIAASDVISVTIDEKMTANLLKDAHKSYNTEVNDLLLAALARVLNTWTENGCVAFDLEGHGREDIIDDVDITRTIGWFTTIFPLIIHMDINDSLSMQVKAMKETLRQIPNKGFNYSILKYLQNKAFHFNPGISFNYLGQSGLSENEEFFKVITTDSMAMMDADNVRENLLDFVCVVINGQLKVNITYSRNKHKKETIQNLADKFQKELSNVITHCLDPASFDITPSDFDLMAFDQEELDSIYE